MTLPRVAGIDARHGLLQAVRDVSFEVDEGETLALVGANGAGKTTLLRTIAGAHRPSAGRIIFDGADVTRVPAHQRVRRGHRARARGPPAVPAPDGRGEPARGGRRAARRPVGRRGRARGLPAARAAPAHAGRQPVGRRAAGDGDRARADDQPTAAVARRGVARARTGRGRARLCARWPSWRDAGRRWCSSSRTSAARCQVAVARRVHAGGRLVLAGAAAEVTREQVTEAYFGLARAGAGA